MTEDPHERELTDLEKEIKELESADDTSEKPEESNKARLKETPSEADKSYEDKTKDEWTRNPRSKETRLTYEDTEIDILEEDL